MEKIINEDVLPPLLEQLAAPVWRARPRGRIIAHHMSDLLDDIINLAVDGKEKLPDILRKCLMLGHELKNESLKEWANRELSGYERTDNIPEYRHLQAIAKGHFVSPYGDRQLNNYPIPPAVLEDDHRHWAKEVYLRQGVSAFEDIVNASGDKIITFPWPGDMVLYYQHKLMEDYILVSAWSTISKSAVVECLDTVRNRTLTMALQIKDELGTSYTDLHRIESAEASKIQSIIFQNTGGITNVGFGQSSVDASGQMQTTITAGDRKALDEVLTKAGLNKPDLDSLTEAMQADGNKPGNKVEGWIKTKASKVLAGGVSVGTKIGAEILTAWIKQHYGI